MTERESSCHIYHGHGAVHVVHPILDIREDFVAGRTPTIALHVPIAEVMTRDVVCARKDLHLDALIPLIVRNHIGCVPVVDERGHPVGMITKLDLVERMDRMPERPPETAEDLMMPIAITLNEKATIAHAAAMMALEDVHHIPVVSPAGAIMGIVSSLDIVRWLARNDGMIETQE